MILLYKRWGVPPQAVADALYRAAGFADLKYGVNQPVVSIKVTISVL